MKTPVASHTFLDAYERCPKQAYHRYVAKDQPFEETEALKWGNDVHKAMEMRVGKKEPLPKEMAYMEPFAAPFDAYQHIAVEKKLGIDAFGVGCGFFDKQVWMRGKADVVVTVDIVNAHAVIADWKTGKRREDPRELEEHAVMLKASWPYVKTITGFYVWLKDAEMGLVHDLSDTEKTLARIRGTMARVEQTIKAGIEWPARDNPLCGWCSVKTCHYNPRRD